ncbi:MAG TPA: ABC transporter ATP-binding protein [Mycobacteriales bacterium]|nr:ABC transporter ATP-binding protein [Mycobacteriales bacterium]
MRAVEIAGVSHRYADREVLAPIDLGIAAGEFVSIVGPSGCGKSTLLKVLAGLLVPTSGTATVEGRSTTGHRGLVAYMPQRDLLLPWRRALDNAVLGAQIAGIPLDQARQRALSMFEQFGLAGFERAWPSELSGGMRQRLALLRTFLLDKDVLLLDEPFGALDAITRRQMYGWLQDVWLVDQRTAVFVTHDVEEAIYLSDRVVVLSDRPGRIVAEIAVSLPRPRQRDIVTDPDFVQLKATVLSALE